MSYIVNFSENFGDRAQSSFDSSVYSIPSGAMTDLVGCGNYTHIKTSISFNANVREACAQPVPALQFSGSGLFAIGAEQTTQNAFGWSGSVRGVDIDITVDRLLFFAREWPAALPINDQAVIDAFGADGATRVRTEGKTAFLLPDTGNSPVGIIQRPSVKPVNDVCGSLLGFRYSTSAQVFGFDPLTCKPKLAWQYSVSYFFNMFSGVLGYSGAGTNVTTDIVDNMGVRNILDVTRNPFAASLPGTLQQALSNAWNANVVAQEITIGG